MSRRVDKGKAMKARRERLFGGTLPIIRPARHDDATWMWTAWYMSHEDADDSAEMQARYYDYLADKLAPYQLHWIIEDRHRRFRAGFGPVGYAAGATDTWILEPHIEWFPWARRENKLRGVVAFLMERRADKNLGCMLIRADSETKGFFDAIQRYAPVYKVGRVPAGRPYGHDYLFYMRGRRKYEPREESGVLCQ